MTVPHLFVVCFVVAGLAALGVGAAVVILAAMRSGGRREDGREYDDAGAASRFTIPVTVVVPLSASSPSASQTLEDLLALNYPELEVIVVAERLSTATLDQVRREWRLEAKEFFYRRRLETAPVHRIYRSARDSRLMVADKASAGRADAMNCGLNFGRYRYMVTIDPGVRLDRNALLRAMSPALRDPAGVAAVVGALEVRTAGGRRATLRESLDQLRSARSLLLSRLFRTRFATALVARDVVTIWRTEAVLGLGGFSRSPSDPSLDMQARLQSPGDPKGRIVWSSGIFGTIAPGDVRRPTPLARWAESFGVVIRYAIWLGRGRFGREALPMFMLGELIAPALTWSVAVTVVCGVPAGWFRPIDLALVAATLSLGHAAVSAAALHVRASLPGAATARDLRRLVLSAPLSAFVPGP